MYTAIDLFAGAGGLSLGFQQSKKFDIKVAFESNPAMQETYRRNHPKVDVRDDVCDANYEEITKKYGTIDVVIGGPPCQGFSNANRQHNHTISSNNNLVKEYVRAILQLKPKAFVMENVSMLKSDVHRFFVSSSDKDLVESGRITTKKTIIQLLDEKYFYEGVLDIVKDLNEIEQYTWDESDYSELNVIYKSGKNATKLKEALKKHKSKLIKIINNNKHTQEAGCNEIIRANQKAFDALLEYYDGLRNIDGLIKDIEASIMYQRMLLHAKELITNELVINRYFIEKGLCVEIDSFAVFDYIKAMLEYGTTKYVINADVLCAADFGAPQKRMRFIAMGIREDLSNSIKLPKGKIKEENYRTVYDAISDLENIEPCEDLCDDVGVKLEAYDYDNDLINKLRDSTVLFNHIVTKTTDVARERFKAIKQGENFHSLDDSLKSNTYTDPKRTQNTIYLRLAYNQPSGTVVNVRKSMWIHPNKDRAISVREAARLQTFPDSFVFMGSKDKQYQQVGNAVPPILAKAIAKKLAKQLDKIKKGQQNG